MSHTPGPWEISTFPYADRIDIVASGISIAVLTNTTGQGKSNARLIAAAPNLLAACKSILSDGADWLSDNACDMLKTAIAKAEGR